MGLTYFDFIVDIAVNGFELRLGAVRESRGASSRSWYRDPVMPTCLHPAQTYNFVRSCGTLDMLEASRMEDRAQNPLEIGQLRCTMRIEFRTVKHAAANSPDVRNRSKLQEI